MKKQIPTNAEVWQFGVYHFWNKHDLRYKLKPAQAEMLQNIQSSRHFKYFIKCSRRLGKTYLLCVLAILYCLKKPGTMVRYAAPTNKALKKFIYPVMRKILKDAPRELVPEFVKSDSMYRFTNGSEIHLAGVNNDNADSLRGTHADLFIIDEAGFVDDLKYLIDDVALPQFLDPDGSIVEGRKLVVSGSPAKTPAHEFTELSREAESKGCYSHYDIYAGGYPAKTIQMYMDECGGADSTTWIREYLALDVVDSNYALVPEWKINYVQEPIVDDKFAYYHKYVSLDIGVRDLTVALFAHYDFLRAVLYVHEEVVLSGPQMTTALLASSVREVEQRLFLGENKAHKRVSDVDLLLLNDLRALHGLYFRPTDKGALEEMVNEVRIWVNAGRVIVSPKCEQLRGCLAYGVWNNQRRDFDRVQKYGHFDALASLMYLIRNVDANINPIPVTHNRDFADNWFSEDALKNKKHDTLKKAFGVKR